MKWNDVCYARMVYAEGVAVENMKYISMIVAAVIIMVIE